MRFCHGMNDYDFLLGTGWYGGYFCLAPQAAFAMVELKLVAWLQLRSIAESTIENLLR